MKADKWNIKLLPPTFSSWSPNKPRSKQIAVLMSGGVDSSVASYLLKQHGWEVLGITMKIPSCDSNSRCCCGADAAFVCNELNIPHYFVDVTEAFQQLIINPFRQSYAKGHTPNPCADCNTLIKFSLVWDFLEKTFGIRYLATGHYARVRWTKEEERQTIHKHSCLVNRPSSLVTLARAKDKAKDQSYFLYGITREKLERFVLPLGDLTKHQVRSIADQLSLSVADKPESMELCFAGEDNYQVALNAAEINQPGDITDMRGRKLGTHKGIANYTLGQRRGINFAGGKPLYVGKINARTNTIALGTRDEVSFRIIRANQINVLVSEELGTGKQAYGKIRSYGDPNPCRVIGISKTGITVEFDKPQFAPCPGQKLVLYDGDDNVIAGGTIKN